MFKRVSLLAVVLALLAMVAVGAPAQAAVSVHGIKIWTSNTCLDEAKENHAKIQSWHCEGGPEQHWWDGSNSANGQFTFHNQGTGWCITAPASGGVTMAPCDEAAATQHWTKYAGGYTVPDGQYFVWKNVANGLCLTASSVYDGYGLSTSTCDQYYFYQRWHEG